jgi:hypothetical protein
MRIFCSINIILLFLRLILYSVLIFSAINISDDFHFRSFVTQLDAVIKQVKMYRLSTVPVLFRDEI